MRTIVVLEARPGMVLHASVVAQDGEPVFAAAHVLAEGDLEVLSASGATEIEIEDAFASPNRALFPAPVEAAALQALNAIILFQPGPDAPLGAPALHKLITSLDELIESAGPELDGEADFAGPDTLQGHDYVHPVKVAELSIVLARALRMHPARIRDLALAAALMNVGYAALRRSLLDEPRALEEHEWQHQVSLHPEYSRRILAESGLSEETLQAIEQHHERWDGSGYPHARKGTEITEFARIIAIADTYVSLRSRRAYRNAVSHPEAIELLRDGANELFDADLVRTFIDVTSRLTARDQRAAGQSAASASAAVDDAARSRAVEDTQRELAGEERSREVEREAEEDAARDRRRALDAQRAAPRAPQPASVAPAARSVTVPRVQPMRPPARPPTRVVRPAARTQPPAMALRRPASLWSTSLYLESARAGWSSTIRR
ncbi:MAG TPA: HD domain-containing phosphohydrolase [Dehalococcoidia bacterium]|nr:HD domain-containing phosphohydrolase [Dehalococcoidia bacterium]